MTERPLLIFPKPEPVDQPTGKGRVVRIPPPTAIPKQAERIELQFATIKEAFVSDEPGDIERVLVMETSNRIDGLQNAINKISGLEWLAEMDVDDIELHDLYDEATQKKVKGGRFYLLASNRQATDRLLGLWHKHKAEQQIERGLGKFKEVFRYLITLRRWDIRDRLRETGILKAWKEEYQSKQGTNSFMDFEIELHYLKNEVKRNKRLNEIKAKVENEGGSVGQSICIKDIAFHALKASLPVSGIEKVIKHNWDMTTPIDEFPPSFNSEAVRYFRPIGQHIDTKGELPEELSADIRLEPVEAKKPVLALLDGAPLLRHTFLNNRVVFSDPDNYRSAYEPSQQKHGTAMASLMCHGDLSQPQAEIKSLKHPIYVRPIMKPNQTGHEEIPSDCFQEDIIQKAVRELFEGVDPVAPGVRVINLSLGNIEQQYLNEMSPWARLLDWLSFKYNVLFIVSAGNYLDPIPLAGFGTGMHSPSHHKQELLKGIDENQRNHRLLSPAESVNALTVGALQSDSSGALRSSIRGFDPIEDRNLPSPYSRIGPGYRNAIKPEIFVQGGRLLYDTGPTEEGQLKPVINNDPPGIQTAWPGRSPEKLTNISYQAGTSHAAAIASHEAGHLFEMLEELRERHADILSDNFDAVLLKTLLVHSASQGENPRAYDHLKSPTNSRRFERYRVRYIGYGNINVGKVLECTRTRATAIGCGRISKTQRHRFIFPLPSSDVSLDDYLRLTVTLAWFSPINPFHIGMRRAKLFFEGNGLERTHGHKRQECDWQQVRKGTVQHEIFELNKNHLPKDGLEFFVECAADAGGLDDEILYGLAITLEIAEHEQIDLYQLVKERIRQSVHVP